MPKKNNRSLENISFGLNRQTDEQSLSIFMQRVGSPELMPLIASRMSNQEITDTVDFLSGLIKKHLSHEEYHNFFFPPDEQG